jgi:hypothetical protein
LRENHRKKTNKTTGGAVSDPLTYTIYFWPTFSRNASIFVVAFVVPAALWAHCPKKALSMFLPSSQKQRVIMDGKRQGQQINTGGGGESKRNKQENAQSANSSQNTGDFLGDIGCDIFILDVPIMHGQKPTV